MSDEAMSDVNSALAEAVAATLATPEVTAEAAAPAPAPVAAPSASDTEPPAPVTADEAATDDAPPEKTPKEADEDAPAALPDGFVAPKPITDKLATEFTIRDGDGEIEVPDVIIEYKANGKVRKDRIDQVVKLAQWGAYNQDKVAEIERTALAARQESEEVARILEQREAQLERLLSDDDYLAAVREAYERENSPERRAARAEEEVQSVRVQAQMERIASQGQQFYRDEIAPALQMIQEALPSVTMQEMEDHIARAMALHADTAPNGSKYLPASQFNQVRQYLMNDLVFWAQMQHARRTEGQTPAAPAAPAAPPKAPAPELAKAQVEAQKAKQALARAVRPMPRSTDGKFAESQRKPSKPINTVDDAMDAAMADVLSSVPQG